jgi:hypothetical protein
MVMDLTIALLSALAGFVCVLWLLLLWVGDGAGSAIAPGLDDPITGPRDRIAIYESYGPYIPMPDHLKTADEMVDWMTKELPKLTADLANGGR